LVRRRPDLPPFPYTTLFRSGDVEALDAQRRLGQVQGLLDLLQGPAAGGQVAGPLGAVPGQRLLGVLGHRLQQRLLVAALRDAQVDRKSTRLNSSHVKISYAV